MTTLQHRPSRWTAIDWTRYERDVVLGGRRVRYVDHGSGPAILLVHGLGGSWDTWLENIPALADHHRVIAVDLPGFGRSDELPPPAEMADHAATLAGLLDRLDLAEVTVAGHSMGGLVGLLLAAAHPGRVRGLVLISAGGARLTPARLSLIVRAFGAFYAVFSIRGVPAAVARRPTLRRALLRPALGDWRSLSPALAARVIPAMKAPGFAAAIRAAARAVQSPPAAGVRCPALLIWGDDDRILPPATGRALAAALPDARLTVLDGVGHCAMFEAADRVNALMLTFLEERGTHG